MKRFFIFFLLILGACSRQAAVQSDCPEIDIPRETSRFYYTDRDSDKFQVNVVGVETYCYTDVRNNKRYAMIAPLFKVRRLENSSITSFDTSFYIKTNGASEDYIGSQNYLQQMTIPSEAKENVIKAPQTSIRIPFPPYDDFKISLGFAFSKNQDNRAKKMFDINYRYLSEEELAAQNETDIDKVYLEVRSDEEVVYSECSGKPSVVKKNRNVNKCGN